MVARRTSNNKPPLKLVPPATKPAPRKTARPPKAADPGPDKDFDLKPRLAASEDPVLAYAEAIRDGKIQAGWLVKRACLRHLQDLQDGADRGLRWNLEKALRAIRFFRILKLADTGLPFKLEPFQQFIIGSIFGWEGRDGHRRYRAAYIEMGKGNGKSPMAAGIGLYGLIADNEAAAEIYAAATMRDQAKIMFTDAERMVRASPYLHSRIVMTVNNLSVLETNSFFRAVSSEARGLDGHRVHMALIDEIHEHPTSMVVDKMTAGTKGRRQALIFEITNAGYDRTSVCWNHHEYSSKILNGHLENDEWFAYICGLDPCERCRASGREFPKDDCSDCDDWKDEKVWLKANPCLDVAVTRSYLARQVREAIGMPAKENIVKRLNFATWTEQDVRWLPMSDWDRCADLDSQGKPIPILDTDLEGMSGVAGLDLATTGDIIAFVGLFEAEGRTIIRPWFWLPEETAHARFERSRVPYPLWVQQGFIKTTPGNIADYDIIRNDIRDLVDRFGIREVGYDRWNATQLVTQLTNDGLEMFPIGQGFNSMTAPSREFEKRVLAHRFQHGGNPVLRWMASNVAVVSDAAGNIKPTKEKSAEKIDGIVAALMALSRLIVNAGGGTSIYETRGFDNIGGTR